MEKHIEGNIERHTEKHTESHAERHPEKHAETHPDKRVHKHVDRDMDAGTEKSAENNPTGKTFGMLGVDERIVRALKGMGIIEPTDIQEQAIPVIKSGKDVIGMSKTGSGKTATFGVPMLELIEEKRGLQAIIITPTRELAHQISGELSKFGRNLHFSIATVFGGVALPPQAEKIKVSEILVGTPGRILDHLQRKTLNLSKIKIVVLDEADKMAEMGFIEDVDRILSHTPRVKQVLLFGATLSDEIAKLKRTHMHEPVVVKAKAQVGEEYLKQYYYNIEQNEKFSLLMYLLKKENVNRAIVFCSSRSTVEMVAKNLKMQGVKTEMLHGKLSQNKRLSVLKDLDTGRTNILVSSPVAARGLDIKDITHIFNYDLSPDPQEYIHRIGRTARAGESGKAITLLSQRDYDTFSTVLRNYDVKVELLPKEKFEKVQFDTRRPPREPGHGRGGPRRYSGGGAPRGRFGRKPGRSNDSRGPRRSSDDQNSGFSRNGPRRSSGYSGGHEGRSSGSGYSGGRPQGGGHRNDKSPRFGS